MRWPVPRLLTSPARKNCHHGWADPGPPTSAVFVGVDSAREGSAFDGYAKSRFLAPKLVVCHPVETAPSPHVCHPERRRLAQRVAGIEGPLSLLTICPSGRPADTDLQCAAEAPGNLNRVAMLTALRMDRAGHRGPSAAVLPRRGRTSAQDDSMRNVSGDVRPQEHSVGRSCRLAPERHSQASTFVALSGGGSRSELPESKSLPRAQPSGRLSLLTICPSEDQLTPIYNLPLRLPRM
jgi:hypothetical protein